jgi:hypothetical protein
MAMRRRVILLLPLLIVCSHCAAPEPTPQTNPSTDSATMAGDPVSAPDPAPVPAATDVSENTVATGHPPLASARPQGGVEPAGTSRRAARAQSDEPVPCDAVDDDVPAADCREYTRQKSRLRPGMLAFDPPAKMTVGVTYDLTLSIGKTADVEEIRAVVRREERRLEERTLQVGAFMTATLTGNAFEIVPIGETCGSGRSSRCAREPSDCCSLCPPMRWVPTASAAASRSPIGRST